MVFDIKWKVHVWLAGVGRGSTGGGGEDVKEIADAAGHGGEGRRQQGHLMVMDAASKTIFGFEVMDNPWWIDVLPVTN